MNRRTFVSTILGALAAPLAAEAQEAKKVWRIGCVLTGTAEGVARLHRAIETSLSSLGYVQGRNVILVQRVAPADVARAESVVRTLVPALDLLIVGGTVGGVAAKRATTTLPTVFLGVGDPVRIGLVASLAHPGGNMTGVTFEASADTYGKRLQLLKEIVPTLAVVGILRPAGDPNLAVAMQSLEQVAPVLGVRLRPFDVSRVEDLPGAFAAMKSARVQGVVVVAGAFTYSHGRRIAELALATFRCRNERGQGPGMRMLVFDRRRGNHFAHLFSVPCRFLVSKATRFKVLHGRGRADH